MSLEMGWRCQAWTVVGLDTRILKRMDGFLCSSAHQYTSLVPSFHFLLRLRFFNISLEYFFKNNLKNFNEQNNPKILDHKKIKKIRKK
jgi:hypothetical protein